MGLISGPEIARLVRAAQHLNGKPVLPYLRIDPFEESAVGPNSVDIRLSPDLLCYNTQARLERGADGVTYLTSHLDARRDNPTYPLRMPDDGMVLEPGRLYLGSSMETVEAHGLVPVIETRSSLARLGVSMHLSAGFCDDGFAGAITYEITVAHPIKLYPGMRVAQVAFHTLVGERKPYSGRYAGQRGPVASRMHLTEGGA